MAACSGLVGVTSLSTTTASSSFLLNSADGGGPPPSSVTMSATTMLSSFSLVVSSCSTWLWAASSSRFLLLIKNNTRHEVFILIFDFTSLLSEFKGTSHFFKFCVCLYCDFFIRQLITYMLLASWILLASRLYVCQKPTKSLFLAHVLARAKILDASKW